MSQLPPNTDEVWPTEAERSASIARVKLLRQQAAQGGLRFECYLPPELALWMLARIERGDFIDPSEAAFVMLDEQHDLEPHADLREELERRIIQAAESDPRPTLPVEEAIAKLEAKFAESRPEPARWEQRNGMRE